MEVVLTAGDMLYLPRGWWHEVTPLEEGSLHLSIGSYAPSLCDYIIWACGRQLAEHPAARRGITHDGDELHDAAELMQLAQQAVLSTASLHEFFKDMQARECLSNEFNTVLFLSQSAAHQLSDGARLSLTSCYEAKSEEVRINGGRMKLEPVSSAIVQQLRKHATLKLSALCAHLFSMPRHSIVNALMELALYEVVSIIDD
jgi:ribosomal protein L16 Arg81 hydroxylase